MLPTPAFRRAFRLRAKAWAVVLAFPSTQPVLSAWCSAVRLVLCSRLVGLRNFYVHGYERLDANEVWATAKRFVPRIGEQVKALIPPDDDPTE